MFEEPPGPPSDADGWAVPGVPVQRQPPALPADLRALQAALTTATAVDLGGLSPQEVLERTRALMAAGEQLRVLVVAGLARVHTGRLHDLDGAGSTARWAGLHGLADGKDLTVAKRLHAFPGVAQQVVSGLLALPAAHALQATLVKLRPHLDQGDGLIDGQPAEQLLAAVLVDGVRMVVAEARGGFPTEDDPVLQRLLVELPEIAARPASQLERVEQALVLLAEHVEAGQLTGCLGVLVDALLPQQLDAAGRRGHDRRSLKLVRNPDGSGWALRGQLDLQAGERLHLLLEAELLRDPDGVLDTEAAAALRADGVDPYGDEVAPTLAPRSRGARMRDALDRGLARYLAADLGGVHDKNPVQIVVTVPLQVVDGRPSPLPCRTGSGTVVPVELAQRWVCGSAISRHVMDLRGAVVGDTHTERTLTRRERRALRTKTRGRCQGTGCRRSSRDAGTVLHPHHADPWSRCGTTSLADTVLLCDSCHSHVHSGHVLRLKDGRHLGPGGWVTEVQLT